MPKCSKNNENRNLSIDEQLEKYDKRMKYLLRIDAEKAFDACEPELNEREKYLDKIMRGWRRTCINGRYVKGIRRRTRRTNEAPIEAPAVYPPVSPFSRVREIIEKDPLFTEVFKIMPKGGNLHIHTSATISANRFVDLILEERFNTDEGFVTIYLGPDGFNNNRKYSLAYAQKDDILPSGVYKLKEMIETIDSATNKPFLDKQTLIDYLTFSTSRLRQTDYIWDEFSNIFARVSSVLKIEKIFKEYYRIAFEELVEDNIDYVELRFGPTTFVESNFKKKDSFPDPLPVTNKSIEAIFEVYKEFKKDHSNFKLKLIISTSRKKSSPESGGQLADIENAIKSMKQAMEWKRIYKDNTDSDGAEREFIVGYDLVSEEDRGHDTDVYAKDIIKNQIDIPFYFHDGESLWADNKNLFAAYILRTKRVGHGVSLYRFPVLMNRIKEKNIALEVCPISNQMLQYTEDLRLHPIAEFMKRGIQCVICSDDPQIFNNKGLAYDFWEVYFATLVDLRAIRKLVKNSYLYSAMDDEEKSIKLESFKHDWNIFIENAIKRLTALDLPIEIDESDELGDNIE